MNFSAKYQEYMEDINQEIARIAQVPNCEQKIVFEAMRYALVGGGKRIRPVLTVAVSDMLGGNHSDAVKVAAAVECIHTYSLIHDDLPCMDNDDLRRGKPTCHKVFPENIALLAGDGLLNLAFELLSDTKRYQTLQAESVLALIAAVSGAAGTRGMIGGQVIDLEMEGVPDVPADTLYTLHRLKTGELIRVAAECGLICGQLEKTQKEYQKILDFSSKLGLAFQIKDDILDVIGQEEMLGKPVGSDVESSKTTFVTLLGMETAKQQLEQLTAEAKQSIAELDNSAFLAELSDYLLQREY